MAQPTPNLIGKSPDVLVVGAGIFGLWAARHAIKAGRKVVVLEKERPGAGASGGFLGALMPHMPDVWNAKKQMQFNALHQLSDSIAELEEDTGLACDYQRCGRIMPLTHEGMPAVAQKRRSGALENWKDETGPAAYTFELHNNLTGIGIHDDWLNPQLSAFGLTYDTLSARLNPRMTIRALSGFVRRNADLQTGVEVTKLDPTAAQVQGRDGNTFQAGQIIIANGFQAYPLLQPILGPLNKDKLIGRGVKGQAVLLELPSNDDLPIVFHDGVYVVPHKGNRVAVGSTSHNEWGGAPGSFDEDDMDFLEKAKNIVPALKEARIIEKWANVRPRNTLGPPWSLSSGTEPFVGQVPGHEWLYAAIGGFKIGLGVAHHLTSDLFAA